VKSWDFRGNLHHDVDVAVGAGFAARDGTEQRGMRHALRARKAASFSRSRSRISCLFMTPFIPQNAPAETAKTRPTFARHFCTKKGVARQRLGF